ERHGEPVPQLPLGGAVDARRFEQLLRQSGDKATAEKDAQDLPTGGPGQDQRVGRIGEADLMHQYEGWGERENAGDRQQAKDQYEEYFLAGEALAGKDVAGE